MDLSDIKLHLFEHLQNSPFIMLLYFRSGYLWIRLSSNV